MGVQYPQINANIIIKLMSFKLINRIALAYLFFYINDYYHSKIIKEIFPFVMVIIVLTSHYHYP